MEISRWSLKTIRRPCRADASLPDCQPVKEREIRSFSKLRSRKSKNSRKSHNPKLLRLRPKQKTAVFFLSSELARFVAARHRPAGEFLRGPFLLEESNSMLGPWLRHIAVFITLVSPPGRIAAADRNSGRPLQG